ncbi:hypothetical protein F4780DRAFT_756793 [Xylariomycetidae sp. FL0641]|nr:hypothetical protein F4780DRAFT_756793 [Xylariomycetidae sp. FL0641]
MFLYRLSRTVSLTRQLLRRKMAPWYGQASANGAANGSSHTVTALSRWSILDKQLPSADKIETIHVYDFDNTLFQTPLPNPRLWNAPTLGQLGSPDIFVNGGWWHDSRILAATGDGVDREEAKAWEGWWNEKIVELVRLSMQQKDALCVLLTGRSERGFSDLIKRIVKSKGLEFDLVGLKPEVGPNNERFKSTMAFKQAFLEATVETYKHAQEIRIYEDRIKHVMGFREFFADYNDKQSGLRGPLMATRGPITSEVIHVADISTTLDPVVEVAEVQHLVNSHNAIVGQKPSQRGRGGRLAIRKTVFFTAYMLDSEDTKRLVALTAPYLPENADPKFHANAIMICARPCPKHVLDKIGGMHAKMKWEATAIGSFENSVWAVSVKPAVPNAKYHTDSATPTVVVATKRGARPSDANKITQWQPLPPDKAFVFDTTVGEKVMLRIEPEDAHDNENDSLFPNKGKRKFQNDDDSRGRNFNNHNNYHNHNPRGYHSGRGQRGGFRGNNGPNRGYRAGARGGRGGGRGGRGGYRSLDDVGMRENSGVSYDDSFPSLPHGGPQLHQQHPHHFGGHQPFQQGGGGGGHWQPPTGPSGFGTGGPDLQNFY